MTIRNEEAVPLLLLLLLLCSCAYPFCQAQSSEYPKVRFHFGGNYEPYDYLVNLPGAPEQQTGFGYELALKMCQVSNLTCITVRDSYEHCWTSDDYPGAGLQSGWYDACSTYTNTFLRQSSVDFGVSYTQARPAGILSRLDSAGNPVVHPTDSNLKGKKLGVVGGWATNGDSLLYVPNGCTGDPFSGYEVVVPKDKYTGPDAAMRALIDKDVDAVFLYASLITDRKNCTSATCDSKLYQGLGKHYAWIHTGISEYQANGTTLSFTRRGSDLNDFLNPILSDFMESKEYADLCNKYSSRDIDCFSNSYFPGGLVLNRASMRNDERQAYCEKAEDPEACLSCRGGFCGCAVSRSTVSDD